MTSVPHGTPVADSHVEAPRSAAQLLGRAGRSQGLTAGLSGWLTAALGAVGVAVGISAIFGAPRHLQISWLLPLVGVRFDLDALSGVFTATTGAVAITVGIYAVGYAKSEQWARFPLAMLPVFVAAMLLVPAAGSVSTFLLLWEMMAAASLVLVLSEHHREAVRSAGVFYAVMTQLGFAAILCALVLLSAASGSGSFSAIAASANGLSSGTRTTVFLLTLLGFGSKAGLLPLHAWLPRAHPEAPSPVSALMSAAMVNMGIYGIIRIDLQLLGNGPRWWGLMLMAIGAVSAVFGVLQASVATDLKRLLAYSTTENMGLITLGLGTAALLSSSGAPTVATIALTAALLHVMSHAAFKTLGFLAAGSVLAATGIRDLDKLGGLARRMPVTTVLFGIAALGASGLPLGAGFFSEWLLLQSLIHSPPEADTMLALAMPLSVGTVALTTGLGIAAMVKAFGVGFLARPRSAAAEEAREAPATMLVGMTIAAVACAIFAFAPVAFGAALRQVLTLLPAVGGSAAGPMLDTLDAVIRLPGFAGSTSPAILAAALVVAVLLVFWLGRWGASHRPSPAVTPLWACGADVLSPRMQYTATSYAEPLQRVFDDVLRPDTDVEITHFAESQFLVQKLTYRTRLADPLEKRLYTPVVRAVTAFANVVRGAHTGSVHLYLAYGALGLLIVLVVAR